MQNPEIIDSSTFDSFMNARLVGPHTLPKIELKPDIIYISGLLHDASMIASTEVGVVIGDGAKEYVHEKALKAGYDHEVYEPLWDKVPYAIEGGGMMDFIPRKLGEQRGIYFAKVLASLDEKEDEERVDHLAFFLATQLLLEQEVKDINGKKIAVPEVKDNQSIAHELDSLRRIVNFANQSNYSELSKDQTEALESLITIAEDRHEDLKNLAVQVNVKAVKDLIELRKNQFQKSRRRSKLGAYACIGFAGILSAVGITSGFPEESHKTVQIDVVKYLDDMHAVARFAELALKDPEINSSAESIIENIKLDISKKFVEKSLNNKDVELYQKTLRKAVDISKIVSPSTKDVDSKLLTEEFIKNIQTFKKEVQDTGAFSRYSFIGILALELTGFLFSARKLLKNAAKMGGKEDALVTELLPKVQEGEIPSIEHLMDLKEKGIDFADEYALLLRPGSAIVQSYNDTNTVHKVMRRLRNRKDADI